MHELAIVQGILGIIERERRARGFRRVKSVELQCGPHSCVAEESLRFLFGAAATEPHLQGAVLRLVRMPATFRCGGCGREFEAAGEGAAECPSCGAADPEPRIRSEILVRSMEVE